MNIRHHGHEHEFEPQYGLPERLPSDERILWQGSPDAGTLARRAFHLRKLGLYFLALLAWQGTSLAAQGLGALDLVLGLVWPVALAALALGAVALLAWLTARTAVYTLTDKRLVMRIGIVLTMTFNLPLRAVESADLRHLSGGYGDLVLTLRGPDRIAYLQLWPHARPWHLTRPQPMLRAIPEAQAVAASLSQAWAAANGQPAVPSDAAAHSGQETGRTADRLQPSLG
jgi:hypothetical protein